MPQDNQSSKKSRNATLMDVAREAGVSDATVSRVLSGYEYVKESTRQKVMDAVGRLGYTMNLQARSLAGGRTQLIGLLVPNMGIGYVGTIIQAIESALEPADYDLIVYTTHRHRGKESTYANAIANGLTEGLLLIAPLDPSAYLNTLREQNFPYVLIDQADPANKSNVVDVNNWQGAYDATCYLYQLGHTRIACITGLLDMNSGAERLQGYKDALAECNLPYREELVIEGNFWQKRAYEGAKALLNSPDRPTAIFASNDLSAFGAMEAIREANLRIPDDISIVGFDDIPQASLVFPTLTTVRQPLDVMGQAAVELLLNQIENPNQLPRRVTLATQLIIRDSCAPYLPERG